MKLLILWLLNYWSIWQFINDEGRHEIERNP